jgi:hypothetical protein
MTALSPHLAVVFAATTAAGFLMIYAGIGKSLLEWRHPRRQCPSCGRRIEHRVCGTCTGR